ncbi:MAG TPA: ABC transporter permease subunit [Lachnospiraceae bacterium]|nr:ABC transporter permease subunit [Lachnospiraceae bacterium]
MINILRADLYRLFRSKSFYICTMILIALLIASGIMMKYMEKTNENKRSEGSITVEVENPNTEQVLVKSGTEFVLSAPADMNMVGMFVAIMITIFIAAEFNERTMKCIVAKGFTRRRIYLSKVITLSVATILMLTTFLIGSFLTGFAVSGRVNSISSEYTFEAIRYLAVAFLLYLSMASIFILVNFIFKNMAVAMAINISGLIFIPNILDSIEMNFHIPLTKYSVIHLISSIENLSVSTGKIVDAVVVGCGYMVVSFVIGVFLFRRADIK